MMSEDEQRQVLRDIKVITDSLRIPVLVIEAGARVLLFDILLTDKEFSIKPFLLLQSFFLFGN